MTYQLLSHLIEIINSVLVPICFFLAWTLVILGLGTLGSAITSTIARAKKMHQIPCTKCQFFTNDHRLKCTAQPHLANTEKAIECGDYRRNFRLYGEDLEVN